MMIAFRRSCLAPTMTQMVVDIDGSWDRLKLEMCRAWDVELEFDKYCVWEELRNGHTVLIDSALYTVFDQDRDNASGEDPFELFATEGKHKLLRIVDPGTEPWWE